MIIIFQGNLKTLSNPWMKIQWMLITELTEDFYVSSKTDKNNKIIRQGIIVYSVHTFGFPGLSLILMWEKCSPMWCIVFSCALHASKCHKPMFFFRDGCWYRHELWTNAFHARNEIDIHLPVLLCSPISHFFQNVLSDLAENSRASHSCTRGAWFDGLFHGMKWLLKWTGQSRYPSTVACIWAVRKTFFLQLTVPTNETADPQMCHSPEEGKLICIKCYFNTGCVLISYHWVLVLSLQSLNNKK